MFLFLHRLLAETMKTAPFLCFITITFALYTDMDENLDIYGIMSDRQKLQPYLDCYLDRKPCSKQAAVFKSSYIYN